jgi:hypothetical protein
MRAQVDGKNLVPLFRRRSGQAPSNSNSDVKHNAIDFSQVADRLCNHAFTILLATYIGNNHAGRAAFTYNLVASLRRSRLNFINTSHGSTFARTQQRNGASIPHGRLRLVARLGSRSDYENMRPE